MTARTTALAAIAVAVIAAPMAVPAPGSASSYRRCGDYVARGETYTELRVKSTTCRTARAVVKAWAYSNSSQTGWRRFAVPSHWRCKYLVNPVRFYCEKSHSARRVRFSPGPGF